MIDDGNLKKSLVERFNQYIENDGSEWVTKMRDYKSLLNLLERDYEYQDYLARIEYDKAWFNARLKDCYSKYCKDFENDNSIGLCMLVKRLDGKSTYKLPSFDMFEDLILFDENFAKSRGVVVEIKHLTIHERADLARNKKHPTYGFDVDDKQINKDTELEIKRVLDGQNIPTKLTKIIYQNLIGKRYE